MTPAPSTGRSDLFRAPPSLDGSSSETLAGGSQVHGSAPVGGEISGAVFRQAIGLLDAFASLETCCRYTLLTMDGLLRRVRPADIGMGR
jgi:hypothetical protein